MSLSRVIKKESMTNLSVCDMNYEALTSDLQQNVQPHEKLAVAGFKPLFSTDSTGLHCDSDRFVAQAVKGTPEEGISSAADMPDGMIYIAEDEIQKQIDDARTKGVEEGRLVAERGLAHVFRALRDGADSLVSLREKVLRESEADLLKLSRMVARKIILQEIRQDPGILAQIVSATVNCCSIQDKITIRLSPDDYTTVMANRQKFEGIVDDTGRIMLTSDDSIKLGGCLVETPTGIVDARIESQLDEVYTRCMEERGIPQESLIEAGEGEQS